MPKLPAADEFDQLVVKLGTLALAAASLEVAIIFIVCRILGQTEEETGIRNNDQWCQKFKEVAPASWPSQLRTDLAKQLKKIRNLYMRRNRLIHASFGIAGDSSIRGVPEGSIVDMRTYGVGFIAQGHNTWTLRIVGKRLHLSQIDRLVEEIRRARFSLVPYLELSDKIKPRSVPLPVPKPGKRPHS
jgi:hypothetical protein